MRSGYDFCGWATRNDIRCSDGRTIRRNAFADQDGDTVPIVFNHQHNEIGNVLGHGLLENRAEGVYVYGSLNDSPAGQDAKEAIKHGDIVALSIYANQLKQNAGDVVHGQIREVSLVLAGANPGAFIEHVMMHSEDGTEMAIIHSGMELEIIDDDEIEEISEEEMSHAEEGDKTMAEKKKPAENKDVTVQEVLDTFTEDQMTVVEALIGAAIEDTKKELSGGKEDMKHNLFDAAEEKYSSASVLAHSDEEAILDIAKSSSVGSFKEAMGIYAQENEHLAHSIDDIEELFPEFHDTNTGEPNTITRDYTWVDAVINGVHKSPYSRIRTRWADARQADFRANGYKAKGTEKELMGNVELLKRTTDPQTIYVKDQLHRDDKIDITDFDAVAYQYKLMSYALKEEIARAILVGDGRSAADDMKISEDHIRPIWQDNDLYTIHKDVDFAATKAAIQGSDTSKRFGDNYVWAEAIIEAALTAREQYKGSGALTYYCTPHMLNVMLLARDLNGRRIYTSVADLAAALNVKAIETVEQFEGLTRVAGTGVNAKTKKLLGLFVNLADYQVGCTKGGEITKFNQFDIDFNLDKFLMETRISGANTHVYSAIALEEDVTAQG